jgi:hypothetical protein
MNAQSLVAKVWNFAHVLRDQGVSYQAYISQISYLLFLKMDEERVTQILLRFLIRPASACVPCAENKPAMDGERSSSSTIGRFPGTTSPSVPRYPVQPRYP